jgi:hypothetical protein
MKRTALKRGTKGLKRSRINPMSDNRKDEQPAMRAWHDAVMERDKVCQLSIIPELLAEAGPCQGRLEANHILPRSRCSKAERVDPANGNALCSFHHAWCDSFPGPAKAAGLLR